jgi:hypothetical protein
MKYSIILSFAFFLFSINVYAQKVGINIANPDFYLDARGTDDVNDGGTAQFATPSQTNFLRFFGGRLGNPNPFLAFTDTDTFHIATTSPDWSTYQRRISVTPQGRLGIGTQKPSGFVHINSHSSTAYPNLRITDSGDNFSRIKMENTVNGGDRFWDIAATTSSLPTPRLNFYYKNDTIGTDLISITPTALYHRSVSNNYLNLYFTNGIYRGYTGFNNNSYRIYSFMEKIHFRSNGYDMVLDTTGYLGLKTLNPQADLDIRSSSNDDGAEIHLGNASSHFIRLFSGETNSPNPIMYWRLTDTLQLGRALENETGYSAFLTLNGQTIGVHNTGGSVHIGEEAGASDDKNNRGNVSIGRRANRDGVVNFGNVAVGDSALMANTGSRNTGIGTRALLTNYNGSNNVAVGYEALIDNSNGSYNVALGNFALRASTAGHYNTSVGAHSGANNSGSCNTTLGAFANQYSTGSNNIAIGHSALISNGSGSSNIAIGNKAYYSNYSKSGNIAIGDSTLFTNGLGSTMPVHGTRNVAVGYKTLYNNTTGNRNVALGSYAMTTNTTGYDNVGLGHDALLNNTEGDFNTSVGAGAMRNNTLGDRNTAFGNEALTTNTIGEGCVAVGFNTLKNTTGNDNMAIGREAAFSTEGGHSNSASGSYALRLNVNGSTNSAFGFNALYANVSGNSNTSVGVSSLDANTTGNFNTALGHSAFGSGSGFSNSTAIGYNTQISSSAQVRIGNSSVSSIGGFTNWSNVSDSRVKTNIQENVPGLDFIDQLRPITYQLDLDAIADIIGTDPEGRLPELEALKEAEIQTGFIAQEVETAAHALGYDFHGVDKPVNGQGHYGLRYAEFTVPLVKAVQELSAQNKALKDQLDKQSQQMSELRSSLEEMNSSLLALLNKAE